MEYAFDTKALQHFESKFTEDFENLADRSMQQFDFSSKGLHFESKMHIDSVNYDFSSKALHFDMPEHLSIKGVHLKNAVKSLGKVADKVEQEAVKVLKTAGEDVLFAPILLFKKPMANHLDKLGVAHDDTILDIATKFATHKNNFEGFETRPVHFNSDVQHLSPAEVHEIVSTILDFFRQAVGLPRNIFSCR